MEALTRKGLTTRPTRNKPGEPISVTTFYRLLSNSYYSTWMSSATPAFTT